MYHDLPYVWPTWTSGEGRKIEGTGETPQKIEDKTGKTLNNCYNCGQRGQVSLKCPSAALFCGSSQITPAIPR